MRTTHRLLLRLLGGPPRRAGAAAYVLLARAAGAYLTLGMRGASLYARGSLGAGGVIPGISDIDMAVVVLGDPARRGRVRKRLRRRWMVLTRVLPPVRTLFDLAIYEERDLHAVAAAPTLTARCAVHHGPRMLSDEAGVLVRPGLYGPLWDWRPLAGSERRAPAARWDDQDRRIAAWLELQFWWRYVSPVCIDPSGPRSAYLCAKLVTEPVRIWLWLARGERVIDREEALRRAIRLMPEEEHELRRTLGLLRSLHRSPAAPLAETLPVLVRLSARVADRLAEDTAGAGTTGVRLAWGGEHELALPAGAREPLRDLAGGAPHLLPLVDWRAVAWPLPPDETLAPLPLDPASPPDLAAAAAVRTAPSPALRAGDLLVMPAKRGRYLRGVQCPVTDPVSFALLDGRAIAAFPNVGGWSAGNFARRAVAEHRAWLGLGDPTDLHEVMRGQARSLAPRRLTLARLFTAARAGLFLDSIDDGDPELPLTAAAVAGRLDAEDALAWQRIGREEERDPPPAVVTALRERVLGLHAYRAGAPVSRPSLEGSRA